MILILFFLSFFPLNAIADDQEEAFKYGTYNAQMKVRSDESVFSSKLNNLPMEHKKYVEPIKEEKIQILDYDEYNPKHRQATQEELARLRQHYRHVSLKEKVPQLSYIAFRYIYALPTVVNDYQNKVSGSTVVQKAAIDVFNAISAANQNQLLLDQRSFGLGASYGKRLSKRTASEWEIMFYQKSFIHSDNTSTGIAVNYDYTDATGAPQVGTIMYNNVEYIQRNLALTYSRHLEFLSFFGESSSDKIAKFVPYATLGVGTISRWNFLRFSSGILGTTSAMATDLTTNEEMFKFMPAFVYGVGLKYQFTQSLHFDAQFKSTQPINDINIQNYIALAGLRIYF